MRKYIQQKICNVHEYEILNKDENSANVCLLRISRNNYSAKIFN